MIGLRAILRPFLGSIGQENCNNNKIVCKTVFFRPPRNFEVILALYRTGTLLTILKSIFFRSPRNFEAILGLYRTGKLHLSQGVS
jgi:hypothetical protein